MYIGLDLGTSGLRALLVEETGAVIGQAEAAYPVAHPHPGWSEQDPADWVTALGTVVAALKARRSDQHIVVTGRNAKPELIEAADLVTEMTLLKHPFRDGVKAQKGVEF